MAGRIFTFDASAHKAADALLPWYVNGTLRGEELDFVDRHVRACGQCQREVAWLRDVFSACAALAPLDDAPLRPRYASDPAEPARQARPTAVREGWRSASPWVQGLLAAQLAAIVVLGTVLAVDYGKTPSYQTLGAATRSAPPRNAVAVVFDPAATEAEIRHIIVAAGARVVDGPTTTHAFVLELPAAQPLEALRSLRASSNVRLVEPLGPLSAGP